MKGTCSWMQAKANKVEGEISEAFFSNEANRFSLVSFNPTITSLYRSVLAVHRTTILSTLFFVLKFLQQFSKAQN